MLDQWFWLLRLRRRIHARLGSRIRRGFWSKIYRLHESGEGRVVDEFIRGKTRDDVLDKRNK